jgi:hypothetical protein
LEGEYVLSARLGSLRELMPVSPETRLAQEDPSQRKEKTTKEAGGWLYSAFFVIASNHDWPEEIIQDSL